MAGDLFAAIAVPCAVGLGLSLALELLLQPRPQPILRRPWVALFLLGGLWLLLFAFELALFRRPWFAAANVLAWLLLVILVNNAKMVYLREPFLFQDFDYFIDTLRHPRLYLPFLGFRRVLAALAGFCFAIVGGVAVEAPLTEQFSAMAALAALAGLIATGLLLLAGGSLCTLKVTLDPAQDLVRLGLLTYLWQYWREERSAAGTMDESGNFSDLQWRADGKPPHLVLVQNESFFDPRRWYPEILPQVLQQFDQVQATAVSHGRLRVPAWGANTVRTEFEVLSGLPSATLGIHRFNPYRRLARRKLPTLAGFLKSRGYRTICIHPYPADFYGRDRILPLMGFDEFIDIRGFSGAERFGPYVSDRACAEKVCALLTEAAERAADTPLFLFVITMENHGPLHLEKVRPDDAERFYSSPPPSECDDLTVFLRHLEQADRMIGMLMEFLGRMTRDACLCFFGDHVPIMPHVYETLGEPDGMTDYVIWKTGDRTEAGETRDLSAAELGQAILHALGFRLS